MVKDVFKDERIFLSIKSGKKSPIGAMAFEQELSEPVAKRILEILFHTRKKNSVVDVQDFRILEREGFKASEIADKLDISVPYVYVLRRALYEGRLRESNDPMVHISPVRKKSVWSDPHRNVKPKK